MIGALPETSRVGLDSPPTTRHGEMFWSWYWRNPKKNAEEIFCPTQMDVHGLSVFVDLDLLWGEALAKQTAAIRSDLGNEWAQKKESKPQTPIDPIDGS